MDPKHIAAVIAGSVVCIVVFSALLVPVVSEATTEKYTYTNEGVPFALVDDNEHTMIIENVDGEPKYTVDGEIIETNPAYAFNNQSTVIYGEDGFLRVWKISNGQNRIRISATPGLITAGANLEDGDSFTVVFDDESIRYTITTTDYDIPIKPRAYLSNESDYTQMIKPVVNSESVVYLGGLVEPIHNDPAQFIAISGYGTLDNLTIMPLYSNVGSGVTVTGETHEITTIDKGNGLYQIDDIAITFTMSDDTTHVGHFTYFIAPTEVEYDNPTYVGNTLASLIAVLPIIAMIGIILAVVGAFVVSRNDY